MGSVVLTMGTPVLNSGIPTAMQAWPSHLLKEKQFP